MIMMTSFNTISALPKRFISRVERIHWPALWHFDRPGCSVSIHLRQWPPLIALGLVLVWYIADPSGEAAAGVVTLGGVLLVSYLWARAMANNVSASRKLRYAAFQVGDELEELVSLSNRSIVPVLWAEFLDRSNLPDYTVSSVRACDSKSRIEWRAQTTCTHQGIFNLGPWELHLGDPFGIFQIHQTYSQLNEILVYPQMAALPSSLLPYNRTIGDRRALRQPLSAETIKSFTTRPYLAGDPLHHIHWLTTARRGETYVKVFEPEASSMVWLIPDFDADVQVGQFGNNPEDSTAETIVVLLASLAAQLLRDQLAVGLLAGTSAEQIVLPQRGQAHLWTLLRAIAPLQPVPDRPFQQALAQAHSLISGRELFITITPSLNPDWPDELARLAHSRQGSGAEAILLDRFSFAQDGSPGRSVETARFSSLLSEIGILARIIHRGEIQPIPAAYGALRRWEFITGGTGRVFVRQAPRQSGAGISQMG